MAFNFGGGSTFGQSAISAPLPALGPSYGSNNTSIGQTQRGDTITVPVYDELLPARSVWFKVDKLLRTISSSSSNSVSASCSEIDDAFRAKQELIHTLKDLESPRSAAQLLLLRNRTNTILAKVAPDNSLRQRLLQRPVVFLSIEQPDGTVTQQEATITSSMLNDICIIADDLMVSEIVAISLYQQAVSSDVPFQSKFVQNKLKNSSVAHDATSVPWMAREIYYSQSPLILHSCLSLLQHRLQENDLESSLNPITEATDFLLQEGLISNLMEIIREYTQRIDTLLAENNEGRAIPGNFALPSPPTTNETATHFWRNEVVLQSCYGERQLAVECLYFIAYSTQMQVDEVISLMDLLRHITNNCIIFDPYTDVPNPMEVIPFGTTTSASSIYGFNNTAPWLTQQTQREKDTLAWERELVSTSMQTGQPQLLRCGCTILVALFSALGDKAVFMDRVTHVPNTIGVGNALFPPGSTAMGGLEKIQKYLNRDSITTWNRPDILGLVMASYSLLLHSSKGSAVDTTDDILVSFRECVVVSLELKSFSFARLSLIPALCLQETIINDYSNDTGDSCCNVTEFFLATVADFASHYMNVFSTLDQPIVSRAKWEQDADADLKARREKQEQEQSQRGNFPKWSDPTDISDSANAIPNQVDLLARPDCIDDVVAFSTAIGVAGPEYALQFWSQESMKSDVDEDLVSTKLIPSQAIKWLEKKQRSDESLRPVYLSFLAALALAKTPSNNFISSAADEVNGLMSTGGDLDSGWSIIVENFRWYIRQLSPDAVTTRAPSAVSSNTGSTAYYYVDQEVNSAANMMFGTAERSKSGEAVSQSRPRELGELNEYILLSNLAILTNVAIFSASARSAILNIHLPIVEADGETVGQESVLAILFALAVMPLSPDIRGSVFRAIAKLLSVEGLTKEERNNVRLLALKGWEMLEEHQILPINLLQQYPSIQDPTFYGSPNMTFPPSSSALAIGNSVELWMSPDPRYAIMYEMEYIESRRGYYPSTTGFLELLSSLFSVGGFPACLGQNWRSRTGCTPYIEYVTDYVLPRATGCFDRFPPLPFRSTQDKSRFTAIALEVIDIVLSRYHIAKTKPTPELSIDNLIDKIFDMTEVSATRELFLKEIVLAVTVRPYPDDVPHLISDYNTAANTSILQANTAATMQSAFVNSSVPRPKSPGYSILAGMLSSKRHTLFHSVISPLIYCNRVQPIQHDMDVLAMVNALYVSTPPTFTSAKDGTRRSWPANARQLLLTSLRPSSYIKERSSWLEREVLSVLKVLCGTLAREESYRYEISMTRQANYIPVLRFSKKSSLPTTLELQPTKLSSLLISSEMENGVVSSIVELIGTFSKTEQTTTLIAAMATAIFFYIERSTPQKQALELFSSRNPGQMNMGLVQAITNRFTLAVSSPLLKFDATLLLFIFDQLLLHFRTNAKYGTFAEVMFGEMTAYQQVPNAFRCVDAMLLLVENVDFVFGEFSAEVATLCFETLYRLIAIGNGSHDIEIALIIAEYLRARDFWTLGIFKLCSTLVSPHCNKILVVNKQHVIHSIAWLLKGIACEFRILSGISREYHISPGLERLTASHPNLFKQMFDVVFSHQGLVEHALCVTPIDRPIFSALTDAPSDEKCVTEAKRCILGAPEVVDGYDIVTFETLYNLLKARNHPVDENGLRLWIEQWNHSVYYDCSSAHLTDAIRLVIETSMACGYNDGFEFTSMLSMVQKTIFQLISCMTPVEDDLNNIESIDATYFTTACRNVASAACTLSLAIGDEWCKNKDDLEFSTLPNLIVLSIACSVADNRHYAEFARIRERVAALAGVLLPIIRACPNQLIQNDTGRFWFQAAVVLAHLCTSGTTYAKDKILVAPSNDDVVMQNCLCEILENLFSTGASNGFSSCRVILTHTNSNQRTSPVCGMLNSIKTFDESVALLVQRLISISPEISELFISSGIFKALQQAADNYCLEETRVLELLVSNVSYNVAHIEIPTYVVGHFEIISALMSSPVPQMLLHDSVQKIITVLGTYMKLFERLVNCFPIGGDTLYAFLRCVTQANVLQGEKSHRKTVTIAGSQDSVSTNSSANFISFLGPVTKLIIHIAENPLPSRMLEPIPTHLKNPRFTNGVIAVIESNSPSWWDAHEERLVDIDYICRIATLGMDLVRFGVILIRHLPSRSTLDEFSLSRCLCRCANAASKIESALLSSREGMTFKSHQNAARELASLRSKIIDSLESILILTLSFVQDQTLINDISRLESCRHIITFALDYTRLDILNVGPSTFNEDDENYPCIISDLCCELRRQLSQRNALEVQNF